LVNEPQKTRCSRPLYNSQPTTNPQPPPQPPAPTTSGRSVWSPGHAWTETTTHHPHHGNGPIVPSGPNRVFIANHQPHHQPRSHQPPKGSRRYSEPGGRCRCPTRQCLRHRAPHHHDRAARAPYPLSREGAP
jgi:hypothetical protein